MLTPGELDQMRSDQRALMLDSVEVDRKTGTTWSEDQQETVESWAPVYEGRGRAATVTSTDPTLTPAGAVTTPTQVAVTLPWDSPTLPVDARVTVTASTTGNPLVGSTVWVGSETTGHLPTARRYVCREVR